MKRHLLLFTTSFPHGAQETFLEAELPHLCDAFETVTILPIGGGGEPRPVAPNVVLAEPVWASPGQRLRFFIKSLLWPAPWRHFFPEWVAATRFERRAHIAIAHRILLYSFYRAALERHPAVRAAMAQAEDTVAYAYWGTVPALAIPALAASGVSCFVRYHRVDLYRHGAGSGRWLARNARYFPWREQIARSAINLFISEHGLRYFRDEWPRTRDTACEIARLGVPDRGVRPQRPCPSGPLVIVSCSTVWPVKQVNRISALVRAMAAHREVEWHHFGSGDPEIMKKAAAEPPPGLAIHLHGWVVNAQLIDFYRARHVDLFVNLSLSEGVPVSIMEAASFGIPVVATAVDGTPEVVVDGESGMLVSLAEAQNADALAQRILRELAPGGMLHRAQPRRLWASRFDSRANYRRLVEVLQQKTCAPGASPASAHDEPLLL